MRIRLSILLLAALVSCEAKSPAGPSVTGGRHVLFIGNSLTYQNDLPGTLSDLAASAGDTIQTEMVALPNLALIDHVHGASNAMSVIRRRGWDIVVLQQGPTSEGPGLALDTLILATQLIDQEVRAQGGRSALYMVWPSVDRIAFFDNTLNAYRSASNAVGGLFLPAGEAWRTAWKADASLQLYGPDGFHPSELGTYLAALVLYEKITGKDARLLPLHPRVNGRTLTASDATVRLLQQAAHDTDARF